MSENSIQIKTRSTREYPYYAGAGILTSVLPAELKKCSSSGSVFVVIDEQVKLRHGSKLYSLLHQEGYKTNEYVVKSGEKSKDSETWNSILSKALESGAHRNTPFLVVGGGVTGDVGGFAAASFMRGAPLIHVPTTLLAMVDSSIGGKTGINHKYGKNLIGAFYQPEAVISDIDFLKTLPEPEWVNGLSETIKHGAIKNPALLEMTRNVIKNSGFSGSPEWINLIIESARVKIKVIENDTLESGEREFLNFGHTFAHALETHAGYGSISHGEAVFIGMLAATHVSNAIYDAGIDIRFLMDFLPYYNPKLLPEHKNIDRLIELMKRDKKVKTNFIRLVLLVKIGKPLTVSIDDTQIIREGWELAFSKW